MPNIKSAKKRVLVNNKKTEQNKNIRSEVKSDIKKIELLIKDNKLEEARDFLPEVFASIDATASKNIFHKKNASNKKAKVSKKLSAALKAAGISETPAPKKAEKPAKKVEVKKEATEVAPETKTAE